MRVRADIQFRNCVTFLKDDKEGAAKEFVVSVGFGQNVVEETEKVMGKEVFKLAFGSRYPGWPLLPHIEYEADLPWDSYAGYLSLHSASRFQFGILLKVFRSVWPFTSQCRSSKRSFPAGHQG